MTSPTLLATPGSLAPTRYRHARELIHQASIDLIRIDPPSPDRAWLPERDTGGIEALAHLARAALDILAEEIVSTGTTWPDPPADWTPYAHTLGLTPTATRTLIISHLDDPDDPEYDDDESDNDE